MNRLVVLLLVLLTLLLGVQRTPEAQVGEVFTLIGGVATGIIVGGCVHATATARPDTDPMAEPPATP